MDKATINAVAAAELERRRVEGICQRASLFHRGYTALRQSLAWIGVQEEPQPGLWLARVKVEDNGTIRICTPENYAVRNLPGWRMPDPAVDRYVHRTGRLELSGANSLRGAYLTWLPSRKYC